MADRVVSIGLDEAALLADIAASLRILAGRPPLTLTDATVTIPEEIIPAKEPEPPIVAEREEPKPVRKAGRPSKQKTGEGGA